MAQIIKRGPETWLVRVFLDRDESTGRRRFFNKTVRGTKKDAEKVARGVARQLDMGEFVDPAVVSFDEHLDRWFASTKNRIKPETHESYRYLAKNHIRPALGARRLSTSYLGYSAVLRIDGKGWGFAFLD